MGVNFKDILIRHPIKVDDLSGKKIIVDGYNMLYQFLSSIRDRDGNLFTNHKGQVTSHLIGLFSRTTNLMQKGLKLAFVFDGKVPALKSKELAKRAEAKKAAAKMYETALASKDAEAMRKYASRTSRLTSDMVDEAKKLLTYLGIPWVQAPSEGEAQAAYMVKKGDGYAIASQDYDSLLYEATFVLQNLSVEGKRKLPGKFAYAKVEPSLIDLKENLDKLELTREKLIWLAMLVGTDYAPSGVKGIGPKKGMALVKESKTADDLFESLEFDGDWKEVLDTFKNMPTTDDYTLEWKPIDRKNLSDFLIGEHDFSEARVDKALDTIAPEKNQKGLGDFL